jgi:spermidine/putrescine-binding protein
LEDGIKIDLKEVKTLVVQDRDRWWILKRAMNVQLALKLLNFVTREETTGFNEDSAL